MSPAVALAFDRGGDKDCILDKCADQSRAQTQPTFQERERQREREREQPGGDRPDNQSDRSPDNFGGGYRPNRDRARPRGASIPGDFDFYVFSLSWSSGFCATGGAAKGKAQCSRGADLGFVVHGLWPQYERGFPQDCGGGQPSGIAMESAKGLFPDAGLARYEWRKHGTCAGKSPMDYFGDVRRARDMIVTPPQFLNAKGDQSLAPADILRAFESVNPRLRPGMAAIGCRSGILQEVRFCLSKDVRDFRPCPEVARQTCRTPQISAPAPL